MKLRDKFKELNLDLELLSEINEVPACALVLHGASYTRQLTSDRYKAGNSF